MANISSAQQISSLFQTIGQPSRLQILLAIGEGETCVCHLEASFGWRQAYLSQHLMVLRQAGLVTVRRQGHYIFYRLSDPRLLDLLRVAAQLIALTDEEFHVLSYQSSPECPCPRCSGEKGEHEEERQYCVGG